MTINTKLNCAKPEAQTFDRARLNADLSSKWYRDYGTATCVVTQPQMRKDQSTMAINDSHIRSARSLTFALTIGEHDSWYSLSRILKSCLKPHEVGGITYAAIYALGAELSEEVYVATFGGAGQPIAPFFNHMDEAAFWADMADPTELEAYCLASFNAMPASRKTAFLEFVQGRQVT